MKVRYRCEERLGDRATVTTPKEVVGYCFEEDNEYIYLIDIETNETVKIPISNIIDVDVLAYSMLEGS